MFILLEPPEGEEAVEVETRRPSNPSPWQTRSLGTAQDRETTTGGIMSLLIAKSQ